MLLKKIAPLLLIPFIENAFKHCSNHNDNNKNKINIVINEVGGKLTLHCSNTFESKVYEEVSGGIGLNNVRRRLSLVYTDRYELDIQKEKDLLKESPLIIMTTAYSEYALESFSYDVIDYLVKPISFNRFLQAINKVNRYRGADPSKEVLFIKSDKQLKKLKLTDILFVQAMQNYVKIVTIDQTITAHMSLKELGSALPDYFIQTHKSYIVSKYKVDKIVDNQVIIKDYSVPISVRLKKDVLDNF